MREFVDAEGTRWCAELISHGRTSGYLNRRVHRPILQFSCVDARRPRRYTGFAAEAQGDLASLPVEELQVLLQAASTH
jgi:hypothetical protein